MVSVMVSATVFGLFLMACKGIWWVTKGRAEEKQRSDKMMADHVASIEARRRMAAAEAKRKGY